MSTQYNQQQVRTRTALLLFIKGAAAPLVLYFENPLSVYEEIQGLIKNGIMKPIEKDTIGPIRKFTIMSNQISAVALQDEQFI